MLGERSIRWLFVGLGGGSPSWTSHFAVNMSDDIRILNGMIETLVIDVSTCFALFLVLTFQCACGVGCGYAGRGNTDCYESVRILNRAGSLNGIILSSFPLMQCSLDR